MNIINNESNTKDTIIKIEPPEQKVCNDIETTSMNLCENIKVEIFEHEVPVFYEDENLRDYTKNSNIRQKIKNDYKEVSNNIEKRITEKKTLDIEISVLKTKIKINELLESNDKLKNDLFFYCEICKVKCLSEKSLECHMMLHDESRKFKCNNCEYRFRMKCELTKHMMKHSEKMFECNTCGYKCKWKYHFHQHMKQKHAVVCGPAITALGSPLVAWGHDSSVKIASLRSVTLPIPYKNNEQIPAGKNTNLTNNYISGSSQQNTTELNIDNSQSQNKDGGNTLYHQCNICDYKSFVKHTLDKHIKLHDLNRKYQCDVCLNRFSTKHEIYRHMSKHSNKKYSCRVCGRQYKSEDGVTRHMYEHEGVQYRCDMCGLVCNSKQLLSSHKSKKHNYSYKCNVCQKMFSSIGHYTYHMKAHLK